MTKKFKIATLGCRTNQYESQGYADQLRQMGYLAANDGEEADLCIINTCTVTEGADSSSRHEVRSLLRSHPNAKVVVTGCMAESAPDLLLQMGSQVQIVPNREKEKLIDLVFDGKKICPSSIFAPLTPTRGLLSKCKMGAIRFAPTALSLM